ncbi:peptidoglycan-recognition protein LD isoform X3 [Drosophila elegans]|uniref:peptidoglycan-recognition protein LD isoform X3 n=1 Tax=Drosophila elegans TaxID=30023 RepID=UPI0007E8754E|nr:peptidoglycan-recognition protein LD isoform X3 [Drosophila elegans]XP_017129557.1 peptidoglycan-recognition protein LD isoform X3 [Drosophila elegans]
MAALDQPKILFTFASTRIAESANPLPCWRLLRGPASRPHPLQPSPHRPPPEAESSQKTALIGNLWCFWSCAPPPWDWPRIYSGDKVDKEIKRLNHFALLAAQMSDLGYRLSLVEHDIWSEMDLQGRGTPLDATNVFTVLFTHTESEECREDCPEVLHKLQSSLLEELPYNFLITGDCQAYKIYGWEYQSHFSKDLPGSSYLVIAFVGNFDRTSPSDCQLKAAQALILESLKRKKLQPDYELLVVGNHAEALQRELQHWPRYASHRRIN